MMPGALRRALFAAACLLAPLAAAQAPVPALKARVSDFTATLAAEQRAALEQKLAALEARKGSQVAVLLVPTTRPETIEQYAIRVFEEWRLGRRGTDDGVLLVVAMNDRRVRIEVGYGLEGAIPDAVARRIIEEDITPRFRQGAFHGGITAGVDRIVRLVDGEKMPPPRAPSSSPSSSGVDPGWLMVGLVGLQLLAGVLQSALGRLPGAVVIGAAAGVLLYFIAGIGAAVVVAVIVFLLCLITSFSTGGSGWSSAGRGGHSGGGWSSGGGGFRGGGGRSGGGGASGGW